MCWRKKWRNSKELSNKLSEGRCELKANEPGSDCSERASGYVTDLLLAGWRSHTVSVKSGIFYIIHELIKTTDFGLST